MNSIVFVFSLYGTFNIFLKYHHMSSSFSYKKLVAIFYPIFFDDQNRFFFSHHFGNNQIVSNSPLQLYAVHFKVFSDLSFDRHSVTGLYQGATICNLFNFMAQTNVQKVFSRHLHKNSFPSE